MLRNNKWLLFLAVTLALVAQVLLLSREAALGVASARGERTTLALLEEAVAQGELDRATADLYLAYALFRADKLPAAFRSETPWSGTLPLAAMRQRLDQLPAESAVRREIESLLIGDCGGWGGLTNNDLTVSSLHAITNTAHFHIEWAPIQGSLTITDYIDVLEEAWTTEVDQFGWAAPPVYPANPPPGNRYHVRIEPLSGSAGFVSIDGVHAGLVGDNPATPWNEGDAQASCMVLRWGMPDGSNQLQYLRALVARELNHAIQLGYGATIGANTPDLIFVDGAATWIEDEVFDTADLNHDLLWPNFNQCMGEYTDPPNAYWITWRGMTEQYGSGVAGGSEQVLQDFWEATSQSASSNLFSAMNSALLNQGNTLANAFHDYAIAVKFNKSCGGGYGYPYCFEEAADYLNNAGPTPLNGAINSVGGSINRTVVDNYALSWIQLPANQGLYNVRLQNTDIGGQLRASLVCDTGAALNVTPLPAVVSAGTFTVLPNFDSDGCNNIVAVITNQGQTADNPTSCTARSYTLSTNPPSADLSGSTLIVEPEFAGMGQVVTFTAQLLNSGASAGAVAFTDTLPADLQIVGVPTASSGPAPTVNGQTITWSATILAGDNVTLTFAAMLNSSSTIFNSAQISDGLGNIYVRTVVINGSTIYVPVARNN